MDQILTFEFCDFAIILKFSKRHRRFLCGWSGPLWLPPN